MGNKQPVLVAVSEDYHYDLDKTRRRTLPAGWRGMVEPGVATALVEAGKGEKVVEPDDVTAKKIKADEIAVKKTTAKKTTAKNAEPPNDSPDKPSA